MSVPTIAKIEDLLILEEGQKVVQHKINRLTAPGENYGSLMLSLDVTVRGPHGDKEINAVAKMVPPNEFIQEVFNTQVTFRNEIGFYKSIVPTLQNFQREHGVNKVIDISPKYYGSRLNINDDEDAKVDSDAALVLENLKLQNYVLFERTEGFDLEMAKRILADLASLHAVALALKLQQPEVFEKKIQSFLSPWSVSEKVHEDMKRDLYKITDNLEALQSFRDRIHKSFDDFILKRFPREPFATVTHNDVWVNNILVKLEGGKPVKTRLVDYQICDYGSPAKDVLFFIFSSVQTEVVKEHYDNLVKFYHDTFTSILQELECDVIQFSFDAFEKELDFEAKSSQFGHIAFMLYPIFLPKGEEKDVTELGPDTMEYVEPTELYKEKLIFFVEEFAKKGWI